MPDELLEPLTRREAIVLVSNSPRCELYVIKQRLIDQKVITSLLTKNKCSKVKRQCVWQPDG